MKQEDYNGSKTYGGATNDYGFSVQQTVEGDFVIGGFTESYGAGIRDMYLIKTNSFGDTLWTRTYGGPSIEAATDMEKNCRWRICFSRLYL